MKPEINRPEVVAALTAEGWRYERALVGNDLAVLDELFWQSDHVVRLGAGENLYGSEQLRAFRQARPSAGLAREVSNFRVVTFGDDAGSITLEFQRVVNGTIRRGRQSQMWIKFPEGWKVVSAHVSLLPPEIPS